MITQSDLKQMLSYSPETGEFKWLVPHGRWGRFPVGCDAGIRVISSGRRDYIRITIDGKHYPAHRLAWIYMMGGAPSSQVDHKNLDPFDNRWTNLRLADHSLNAANRAPIVSHGFKWVQKRGKRWAALITIHRRQRYLGTYDTPQEAHAAALQVAIEAHGEFARSK